MRHKFLVVLALVLIAAIAKFNVERVKEAIDPVGYWEDQVKEAQEGVKITEANYKSSAISLRILVDSRVNKVRAAYFDYIAEGVEPGEARLMAAHDIKEELRIEREIVDLMKWQLDEHKKYLSNAQANLLVKRSEN